MGSGVEMRKRGMAFNQMMFSPVRVYRFRRLTVPPTHFGMVFQHGAIVGQLPSGRPRMTTKRAYVQLVDRRETILTIPTQEVLSADGVSIKITVVAMVQVMDPTKYLMEVSNSTGVMYLAVQIALRKFAASTSLEDLLAGRNQANESLLPLIEGFDALGVQIKSIEIKDIILPADLKRANAQILVAKAEGNAMLERARGEQSALRNLANAAKMISDNPALYQLRLLQSLNTGAGNSIVVHTKNDD